MNDREKPRPPRRFDFVVMFPTDEEISAGQEYILDPQQTHPYTEGGLSYSWGYIHCGEEDNKKHAISVAIVSPRKWGQDPAESWTKKILDVLDPTFILLIGHMLGVSTDRCEVEPGMIIVPELIRHGPFKIRDFRPDSPSSFSEVPEIPIFQPSPELIGAAKELATSPKWLERVTIGPSVTVKDAIERLKQDWRKKHSQKKNINGTEQFNGVESKKKQRWVVCDREAVSGYDMHTDQDSPAIHSLSQTYPRMVAYEVEAGAVGKTLLRESKNPQYPTYLVVKAISDCLPFRFPAGSSEAANSTIDKKDQSYVGATAHTDSSKGSTDEMRDKNKPQATKIASVFAKELMVHICLTERLRPRLSITRVIPRGLDVLLSQNCFGVLHKISRSTYSDITIENLSRIKDEPWIPRRVFTVCPYEPCRLLKIMEDEFPSQIGKIDGLISEAKARFEHFEAFSKFAKDNQDEDICHRILLFENENWVSRINEDNWKLWDKLNDGVTYYGCITTKNIIKERTSFFTDFVVIGPNLLLDYYENSQTLLISQIEPEEKTKVARELFGLLRLFEVRRHVKEYFLSKDVIEAKVKEHLSSAKAIQ